MKGRINDTFAQQEQQQQQKNIKKETDHWGNNFDAHRVCTLFFSVLFFLFHSLQKPAAVKSMFACIKNTNKMLIPLNYAYNQAKWLQYQQLAHQTLSHTGTKFNRKWKMHLEWATVNLLMK